MQTLRTASRWLAAVGMAGVCALVLVDGAAAQSAESDTAKALRIEWKPGAAVALLDPPARWDQALTS